jgi:hypothetical protein
MTETFTIANLLLLGPTFGPTELLLGLVILVPPLGIVYFFRRRSDGKRKSQLVGFVLVLLFGPIGLTYLNRGCAWDVAAVVVGVVWIPLAIQGMLIGVVLSIASLIFGFVAVRNHNLKLAQEAERTSPDTANVRPPIGFVR